MNEFAEMIKEVFKGDETIDPHPGLETLKASVRKFERRMQTVRVLAWFSVLFMTGLAFTMLYLLLTAEEGTEVKTLVIYGVVMLFGWQGVAFGKLWFSMMHNHISALKEQKRTQMMLLEHLLGEKRIGN